VDQKKEGGKTGIAQIRDLKKEKIRLLGN